MDKHFTFTNLMQNRISNIKVPMDHIMRNDLQAALNCLSMKNDETLIMDILNATFAKNKRIEMLNFERTTQLMPFIKRLIESKYETYNRAGLKSALNVLRAFSPQII